MPQKWTLARTLGVQVLTSGEYGAKVRALSHFRDLKMSSGHRLIGSSAAMQEIQQEIECAARSDAKVLITGESGVGKEVVARLIHQQGRRRDAPFIAIKCAGASDSALSGCLEQAHGGTVFLDEIGEMSLPMQAALLRFLEHTVDVRIIAATSTNLHAELSDEQFREDLYYRLNIIHIVIPPLRDRKEDLPLLLAEFMRTSSQAHGVELPTLLTETRDALLAYSWPGNVRELKNVADRMVSGARSGVARPADLPSEIINAAMQPGPSSSAQPVATPSTPDSIFERMTIDRESFWAVVYEHMPFQKFRSVPASAELNRRARRSLTKAS